MNQQSFVYRFGEFRLDVGRRLLFKEEELVLLPPKAYEILQLLVENNGQLVEKNELMRKIWHDSFVEDNNLTVNVTIIRKALQEKSGDNKFILTVPRRGYRFIAEVTKADYSEENNTVDVFKPREIIKTELEILPHSLLSEAPEFSQNKKPAPRKYLIPTIIAVALLICCGFVYWNFASRKIESLGQIQTLAILPFKPLVMSEPDSILGVGMADAVISKLSGIKRITVRPTSAIVKYAALQKELNMIGTELGVDALLDGNIQRTGDKLRVSVQLIRVSDNSPLWASTFEAKESDIFALQDSISSQVTESLALKLNDAERQQINKHSTQNPEAYKLYLNGIYQLNKRKLDTTKLAISYFEQAIEKQPDYALAYTGLGDGYVMLGNQEALLGGLSLSENIPKAKSALTKALNLDNTLAEAHASMAWVSIWETGDVTIAMQKLQRALELKPDSVNALHYKALLLMIKGEFDQALIEMRKAQQIDQFSLVINVNIGTILLRQKRYQEAEIQCRQSLELDPNFPRAHWVLGLVLEQQGKFSEAINSFQRAVELSNGGTLAKASLAHAYAKAGNKAEAEKILLDLIANSNKNYVSQDALAAVHTALGNSEKAFFYLDKAVKERQFSMFQLKIEPHFDELRSDARFQEIELRMQNKPSE